MPTYSLSDIFYKVRSPWRDVSRRLRGIQQVAAIDQLKAMIETVENGTDMERITTGVFALKGTGPAKPKTPSSQIEMALDCLYWELIECFFVSRDASSNGYQY